jgi:hypothetical protein
MSHRLHYLGCALLLLGTSGACGKKQDAPKAAEAAKPAAPATPAAPKATKEAPKQLPAAKKPATPVPSDWAPLTNDAKGYSFVVPAGTEQVLNSSQSGIDLFAAKLPEPYKVEVLTVAFKDRSLSKDELLAAYAPTIVSMMGAADLALDAASVTEIDADYYVGEFTMSDEGAKKKGKVLVGTDVTDNYIMFVVSPEADYEGQKDTIDVIWSSFSMWSGGASGVSQ